MAVAEKRINQLKESFKTGLISSIRSILELIENKTEIEQSYLETAKTTAKGLEEIAEIKRDNTARIMFKNCIKIITSKNIEKKTKELSQILDFVKEY